MHNLEELAAHGWLGDVILILTIMAIGFIFSNVIYQPNEQNKINKK